jgi:uncharacterized protein
VCYTAPVKVWAVVLLGGFVAMSLWNFWFTVRPPRIAIPGTPRDHGLPHEDVTITTADGLRLAAWLIPAAPAIPPGSPSAPSDSLASAGAGPAIGSSAGSPLPARAAVVLLHGYPAEKADMLSTAAALHPDFTTLLVDLRHFGRSEGRATTLGLRERHDLARMIDVLAARGFDRIGVFGYSLGGAVALLGAAEDGRVRAVVAYAPFSDLRMLGREVYGALWIFRYPLTEMMVLWGRLFLGGDLTRPSPADAAEGLDIPVLLVHNRGDEQIPFAHAERLRAALARNRRAEFAFGAGLHNDRPPDFDRRLVEFFLKHLR